MTRFPLIVLVALCAALAAPATHAQSPMTENEIADVFKRQKTRGLTLIPTTDGAETEAGATGVAYQAQPEDEQVNIAIRFDINSAALRADQKPALAALCNVLKTEPVSMLRIVGHTDITGAADYNERLSLLRAEEVKRYLASDCAIREDQMDAVGVGSRFPLDEERPEDVLNRRVEFQALS